MPANPMKDIRGYFMLPQSPEQSGFYTYGTPGEGKGQYAHSALLSLIFLVENQWSQIEERKFGVGNISLAGGPSFSEHSSHSSGLTVDIRPLRLDGARLPVTRFDDQYDRKSTAKLIQLFMNSGRVAVIYFNDLMIPGVKAHPKHDNHFHVQVKE